MHYPPSQCSGQPTANLTARPTAISRRSIIASSGALLLASPWPMQSMAQAQTKLRPTAASTEGPFYPAVEPKDADYDLLQNGTLRYTKGAPVWVEGTVTDTEGKPLKGGTIEIWQCDEAGHYDHPRDGSRTDPAFQGFGRVTLSATGQFKFRTIKPVLYSGRTPPHSRQNQAWKQRTAHHPAVCARRSGQCQRQHLAPPFRARSRCSYRALCTGGGCFAGAIQFGGGGLSAS